MNASRSAISVSGSRETETHIHKGTETHTHRERETHTHRPREALVSE